MKSMNKGLRAVGAPRLLFSVLVVVIAGCVTVPDEPSWIDDFPSDSRYYIGIGSSNTGDKSRDQELARSKAMANLAASISTEIRSDQTFVTRESSTGEAESSAEVVINEAVNQNLTEVETVDSYYSPDIGYWFYLRINRQTWERIQSAEMRKLEERVLDIVDSAGADTVTGATRIGTLWKAWELVMGSPYAGLIETSLGGNEGILIDLIERELADEISALSIGLTPDPLVLDAGQSADVTVDIRSSRPGTSGSFAFDLYHGNELLAGYVTDDSGRYSGSIALPDQSAGRTTVTARIDLSRIGVDLDRIPRQIIVPEADFAVEIRLIRAAFDLGVPEGFLIDNPGGPLRAYLSDFLPVEIVDSGSGASEPPYSIRVTLSMREGPKNDYGILFVYLQSELSVLRGGSGVFSARLGEVKGGGLDSAQAQQKAFEELMNTLKGRAPIREGLIGAFRVE